MFDFFSEIGDFISGIAFTFERTGDSISSFIAMLQNGFTAISYSFNLSPPFLMGVLSATLTCMSIVLVIRLLVNIF